jgi:hypothetical protein
MTMSVANSVRGFLKLGAPMKAWEMLEDLPPEQRTHPDVFSCRLPAAGRAGDPDGAWTENPDGQSAASAGTDATRQHFAHNGPLARRRLFPLSFICRTPEAQHDRSWRKIERAPPAQRTGRKRI